MTYEEAEQIATGPVVLVEARVDAYRQLCRAGTQIAPQVHGWPEHRVVLAVLHGHAKPIGIAPVTEPAAQQEFMQSEPATTRRERKKKKAEGPHGL